MELLLNVVWVLIGGLALWSFLGSSSRSQKRFLFALVALFCAVLLLFPAISISDDLHFQAFVSEDSSASKWLPSAAPTSPIEYWATLLLAILLALFHRSFWFIRKTKSILRLSTLLDRPVLGRAPPALILA
jgi:purine-cytosine permease-like protein